MDRKGKQFASIRQKDGGYGTIKQTGPARNAGPASKRFQTATQPARNARRRPQGRVSNNPFGSSDTNQTIDRDKLLKALLVKPERFQNSNLSTAQNRQRNQTRAIKAGEHNSRVAAQLLGQSLQDRGQTTRSKIQDRGQTTRAKIASKSSLAKQSMSDSAAMKRAQLSEAGASQRQTLEFNNENRNKAEDRRYNLALADRAAKRASDLQKSKHSWEPITTFDDMGNEVVSGYYDRYAATPPQAHKSAAEVALERLAGGGVESPKVEAPQVQQPAQDFTISPERQAELKARRERIEWENDVRKRARKQLAETMKKRRQERLGSDALFSY